MSFCPYFILTQVHFYIKGFEKVIYTDCYATNLVNVAAMAAKDENVSAENRAHCESLIETEKEKVRQKYNHLEKKQLTNNLSTPSPVPLDVKYQLGEGGVSVREVVIETGDENADPLEIFQVTDLHFNYCNDEDFEEANPSIMATFAGHYHSDYKTEICAKTADGEDAIIPQYVLTGNPYDGGHVLKITVK